MSVISRMRARPSSRRIKLSDALPLFAVFLFTAGVSALPADGIQTDTPSIEQTMAAMYADAFDVPVADAFSRLELQKVVGQLETSLEGQLSDVFAGLIIKHRPDFSVVVYSTDPDRVTEFIRSAYPEVVDLVAHERVAKSLKVLSWEAAVVRGLAETTPYDVDIDLPRNVVEVQVESREELGNFLAARSLVLPGFVDIVEVRRIAVPAATIKGGLTGTGCTMGFTVKTSAGVPGVSTAAHCPDSQTVNGYNLAFQGEAFYGSYDVQWNRGSGHSYPNAIYAGVIGSNLTIYGTTSRSYQSVGGWVCKYGKETNGDCGTIVSKTKAPGYIPSALATTMEATHSTPGGDMCTPGDSGGPVFNGSSAYGTITGCAGAGGIDNAMYIASNYVESGLSVTIKTSP